MWWHKKPKNMIARVLITILLAFYIFLGGSSISSDDSKSDTSSSTVTKTTDGENTTRDAKTSKDNKEDTITVGSTFEVKGLKITINDANTNFTDWGKYDSEHADGMKYIMVNFTFENTKEKGDKYVSIYDFDCYADNASCDQVYLSDDSNFVNTNLSPGRNVSFTTYYEVPENATSIELEYKESMRGDSKTKIVIQ